jgi:hypothetical protein
MALGKVRCKFAVTKVTEFGYGGKRQETQRIKKHVPANTKDPDDGSETRYDRTEYESTGIPIREVTLTAQYDAKNPEDVPFAASTPSGSMTFTVDNPAVADHFKPGQFYYIDLIPAE